LKNFKEWESQIKEILDDFPQAEIEVVKGLSELKIIEHEVLVSTRFCEDDLKKASNLKLLIAPKAGLEKLPLGSLNKRNVRVLNSNANSKFVAERAIGMTLSLLGRISEFDADLREGEWFSWGGDYKWSSISQFKCGIIGFGSIGKRIHRILKAFDCETLIYTRSKEDESIQYSDDLR
jgi:lactate dehydrogenase-like 2-hydroxyacid dehydrogenase